MIKKIFGLLTLILTLSVTLFSTAEAAKPQAELLNIVAYNLDRETVRIQIDYRGRLSDSDINLNAASNMMTLSMNNTSPGRINKIIRRNIQAKNIIENVSIDYDDAQTKINFAMMIDFEVDGYTASMKADNFGRSFSQIIIDVVKTNKTRSPYAGNFSGDLTGHVIVLDAGHGGSDRGAVGPSGLTEKEVTLAVALKTESILSNAGANVVMTRRSDVDVASPNASNVEELGARVAKAPYDAEIFISIHCNAFSNPQSNGMETFYYSASPESYRLAALLNDELLRYGGLNNRGIKSANFYVIKHSNCPSSLIELGFITNYEEESLLADDEYQNRLAQAIVAAINRFFYE